jgi:hypothetical protein
MYNFKEDHDLQARFASLARKVVTLKLKKRGQLKSVQEIIYQMCQANEHLTNDCQLCLLSRNVFMIKPML